MASAGKSKKDSSSLVVASFLLVAASAVDQDVNVSKGLGDSLSRGQQRPFVQHIGLNGHGLVSLSADLVGYLLSSGQADVEHSHTGPTLRQSAGQCTAQHTPSAGDHRHLAGEIERSVQIHRISPPCQSIEFGRLVDW